MALIFSTAPSHAAKELAPDTIFKRYKDAVVRIEVFLHGASLGVGSGFFISKTGEIATSLHVVRPFLVHPDTEIKVKLANGKVFSAVKVGSCGDSRGVDLCLLKIEQGSPTHFSLTATEVSPGESIVAIGHPRGLDFSISTGIVSALRTHPAGWNEVQIDAAISPGNSGGPIINRYGQAIGVVYQFERDGQNLNFGILAAEVKRLNSSNLPYLAANEARKDFVERSKRHAKRATERWLKPAIQSFTDIRLRPTGLKWMRAQLGTTSFLMMLPDIFQNCEKAEAETGESSTSCASAGSDLIVTVQKRPRSLEGSLANYRGKKLVEARALAIVERLEAEGTWENSKTGKSSFYSRPGPARCAAVSPNGIRKQGFFATATSLCRFDTENDSEPGAVSSSLWIEAGNVFYGINVWTTDPGKAAFLQGLTELIFVSAGAASDDIQISYRAKLRAGLKRDASAGALPSPEFESSDAYSDDISVVTIAKTAPIAPSQMNRTFLKWAHSISKSPAAKPGDVTPIEIAKHPARTAAWVIPMPTDRRRNALLMMSAAFTPSGTWLIYEVQPLPMSQGNRTPAKSIATDIEKFRIWTQDFEPVTGD